MVFDFTFRAIQFFHLRQYSPPRHREHGDYTEKSKPRKGNTADRCSQLSPGSRPLPLVTGSGYACRVFKCKPQSRDLCRFSVEKRAVLMTSDLAADIRLFEDVHRLQ